MRKLIFLLTFIALLPLTLSLFPLNEVFAQPSRQAEIATPSQLINAVNGLRLAYGLPALTVDSVLMQVAQIEADGIANGANGHWRPNGMSLGQWLISLGYPLSGDLSLDGYRSENWTPAQTADEAVEAWRGDDIHTNTMLSSNRSDIGAGVAVSEDGQIYFVLETALRTRNGQQQALASTILTNVPAGSMPNNISEYINPVILSTARPDGDVFHKVQYGQSLWSIAIKYDTTIKNIQALNFMGEDLVVYEGQSLLVKKGSTQLAPATPTGVSTPVILSTPKEPSIIFPETPTLLVTETLIEEKSTANPPSSKLMVGLLIVASFVGGGAAVWLIRDPK